MIINGDSSLLILMVPLIFGLPGLVNVYITMEHHHAINGKIHYIYGHFQ
jgi:hypothetical protein